MYVTYKNTNLKRLVPIQLQVAQVNIGPLEKTPDSQPESLNKMLAEQVEVFKNDNEEKCWVLVKQF